MVCLRAEARRAAAQALADAAGDRARWGARARSGRAARAGGPEAQLELVGGAHEGGIGAGRGAAVVGPVVARRVQRRPSGSTCPPRRRARTCASAREPARPARPTRSKRRGARSDARGAPAGGGGRGGQRLGGEVELEQGGTRGEGGRGRAERARGDGGGAEAEGLAAGGLAERHGHRNTVASRKDRSAAIQCAVQSGQAPCSTTSWAPTS